MPETNRAVEAQNKNPGLAEGPGPMCRTRGSKVFTDRYDRICHVLICGYRVSACIIFAAMPSLTRRRLVGLRAKGK